jgi:pimeloyl-ACP methyl ester carboxylesterase
MERTFSPPTTPWRARRADDAYGLSARPDWREIDWAAQLRRVEIDGTRVNYVDLGSGDREPVVFVHGLGGQWQNWLENLPRVAQERRVLALDLPGFGLTPEPREKITIPWYGRCVEAFCEKLGLGEVALVGNSMGGFIAAEVAIQFPSRVSRLVLVSAAGISSSNVRRRPVLLVGRVAAAIIANTAPRHRSIAARPTSRHLSPMAFVARYPKLLRPDLVYEGFFKGTGKPGFDDALRANLEYDFMDRLPEVRVPTLIIWGENDSIIPVRDANEFERLIPDSRKVVMQETGHIPMAERPQAFNDLLLDFLAETGPAEEKEAVEGEAQVA